MTPPPRNAPCPCGSLLRYKHCCGRILAQSPRAEAGDLVNLGNRLARAGRLDEALVSYQHALEEDPNLAEAHNNRGNALSELGQQQAAFESYSRAIAVKPQYAEAHANAGIALLALGRTAQAAQTLRRATRLDSLSFTAHQHLGGALHALGELDESIAAYRRALVLDPGSAEIHNSLGSVLRARGRLDEALHCFRCALSLQPAFGEAHRNLALALRLQGRTEEARASCRRALELEPRCAQTLVILAETYADTGDFTRAHQFFRQATELEPRAAQPWAGLARYRKMTAEDSHWASTVQRMADEVLPAREEVHLRYALGKYFDDIGEFEAAFSNFRRANEITKSFRAPYDPSAIAHLVARIIVEHDRVRIERMERIERDASASQRCIFVVGMLRSGTTLAEQILASHPTVHGAGEMPNWSTALEQVLSADGADTAIRLETAASNYLSQIEQLAPDARRVVDKMPSNFLLLGLIHANLPDARFIHMRRHPLDVCLSIYFQYFEAGLSYANDLVDLAHYYREYLLIMKHWRTVLPRGCMLEVPYEGLVREQEHWTRRMLDHIGLAWDPRCLSFQSHGRTVITASKWQVRQTISTASVGRWRNYEKFLAPLLSLLKLD
jgi:tetratricopeptide (TPR) repeat protein